MTHSRYSSTLLVAGAFLIATGITTPGHSAGGTIKLEGKTLRYLGMGLREFLFFDIYNLSAYSESGACSVSDIITKDEAKALHLHTLRDIPIDRLKSNLKETFEENLPKGDTAALKRHISTFLGRFKKDLAKGVTIKIAYIPGKGTSVTQDGKAFGPPTPGKDFADLIWRSYFGSKTCCSGVKSAILEQCGK